MPVTPPGSARRAVATCWAVDILRCVVCGSCRVLIEVTEPGAVQQILCHLALDSEGPARLPARGPPDDEVA